MLPLASLTFLLVAAHGVQADECLGDAASPCRPPACGTQADRSCARVEALFACGDGNWFDGEPLFKLGSLELGEKLTVSGGGEFRYRYMNEINRLRPLGETRRNTYDLFRNTVHAQVKYDWITGFVEGIDAVSFNEDLPPVPIDENRSDLQRYYLDIDLFEVEDVNGHLHFKVGRQYLIYGKERLVSNLGWANTFRNFEGFKMYYADDDFSVDVFAVQPVNGAASPRQYHPYSRDIRDSSQWFAGVYTTLKTVPGLDNVDLDLYWLHRQESERALNRHDGNRHTFGLRIYGGQPIADGAAKLGWDVEGAYQVGKDDFLSGGRGQDVRAGFVATDLGVTLTEVPWSPTFKFVFHYGTGDDDPTDGVIHTFDTLFPLGHAYWGIIDQFNGSNLFDFSPQIVVKPTDNVNVVLAYHHFEKAEAADFIYNIANAPLGNLITPSSNIGDEFDVVATVKVSDNFNIQPGYSYFWYNDAVSTNAGIPPRGDAHFFYLQTTLTY